MTPSSEIFDLIQKEFLILLLLCVQKVIELVTSCLTIGIEGGVFANKLINILIVPHKLSPTIIILLPPNMQSRVCIYIFLQTRSTLIRTSLKRCWWNASLLEDKIGFWGKDEDVKMKMLHVGWLHNGVKLRSHYIVHSSAEPVLTHVGHASWIIKLSPTLEIPIIGWTLYCGSRAMD